MTSPLSLDDQDEDLDGRDVSQAQNGSEQVSTIKKNSDCRIKRVALYVPVRKRWRYSGFFSWDSSDSREKMAPFKLPIHSN